MEVHTKSVGDVSVVEVSGDVDGSTSSVLQEHVLALAQPGCKLIVDMSSVGFMSSAGLRVMLLLYRQITGNKGKVVLVGLSEGIQDTMSATGFLKYFITAPTFDAGLASLQ